MPPTDPEAIPFQRCQFATELPVAYLYTPSHFWLWEREPGLWRVGLTSFATRMLGEIVELEFDAEPGLDVAPGDRLGSIEGFKAVSDVFCMVGGALASLNTEALADTPRVDRSPHGEGWLYEVRGHPTDDAVPVREYGRILEETIDRLRAASEVSDPPAASQDPNS